MELIVRTEPVGVKYMEGYPQFKGMLHKARWLNFIKKFDGYHKEITKSFARSFDGTEVEMGDIKFAAAESFIVEATKLSRQGERWFKNKEFHGESWKVILRNLGMNVTIFRKGIPISALKNKWSNMLLILQKFSTCEGRFGFMYVYHICLLMIFLENLTINLPFFLLNSLRRMATHVQKKIESIETTMYYHGLVKILVEFHLKSVGDTWEDFLVIIFFQDTPESPEESHVKKSRRRKININIQTSSQKNDAEKTSKPEVRKQTKQKGKMKERAEEINEDIPKPSSP